MVVCSCARVSRSAGNYIWTPVGLQPPPDEGGAFRNSMKGLVGLPGFEPGTSCTPSKRASQAAPQPDRKSFYHKGFGRTVEFRQDFQNALSVPNCYQALGIFLNPFSNPVGDCVCPARSSNCRRTFIAASPSFSPPLFDQPLLTRADGSSQTQRFPFILPVPGSPAV